MQWYVYDSASDRMEQGCAMLILILGVTLPIVRQAMNAGRRGSPYRPGIGAAILRCRIVWFRRTIRGAYKLALRVHYGSEPWTWTAQLLWAPAILCVLLFQAGGYVIKQWRRLGRWTLMRKTSSMLPPRGRTKLSVRRYSWDNSRVRPHGAGVKLSDSMMLRCIFVLFISARFSKAQGMMVARQPGENSIMNVEAEAAPVPNPGVLTEGEHNTWESNPGQGRSEGWGSRRTPGNGEEPDIQPQNVPMKIGDSGQQAGNTFSRIRKRAYKRAINRAQRGSTMYRGRQYTLDQLRGQYVGRANASKQSSRLPTYQPRPNATDRMQISCLTWNCGGLSTVRDELFTWLDEQPYDVVFLQETWHRQAMEYTTRGWHCISSGVGDTTKRAQAGVMTLLRASVFPQDHIRFHAHVDGRVLQVKAFCQGGWIETINVYQHVMVGHHQRDSDLMQKRAHVWKTLRTIIGQIPHGSKMVVAGDLNCNMGTIRDCTGTGMVVSEEASPDREDMVAILQISSSERLTRMAGEAAIPIYMKATSRPGARLLTSSW